jgi:YedE family putative selenium metabolism protein
VTRFVVALVVMIGAMVFLGCPLRMLLRIGGGDLNAVVGLGGFAAGIFVGTLWLKSGFTLRRAYPQGLAEGAAFPAASAVLLLLFVNVPALFRQSASGAGSLHAPVLVSLGAGLLAGALSQRSRFCVMSSVRNVFLFRDGSMLLGVAALVVAVFAGNLLLGYFRLSFAGQPAAQTDALWNFLSMALVGWGSVLLNGCPLRQLVLAGEGDSDAAVTVLGFLTGAALCHNFGLVSFANGPTENGMAAVIIGFVVLLAVGLTNREQA